MVDHIRMMTMVDIMVEPMVEMAAEIRGLDKGPLQKHLERIQALRIPVVVPVVEKEPEDELLDMEAPVEIMAVEMVDTDAIELVAASQKVMVMLMQKLDVMLPQILDQVAAAVAAADLI